MTEPTAVARRALVFARTGDLRSLGGLTPWALEDELMSYAKAHAGPAEHESEALTRLTQHDDVAKALARAAYHADLHLKRTASHGEQLTAFRKHFGLDDELCKAASTTGSREHIADLMDAIARREARPDEDFFAAYDRLLKTDSEFRKAYDAYSTAKE